MPTSTERLPYAGVTATELSHRYVEVLGRAALQTLLVTRRGRPVAILDSRTRTISETADGPTLDSRTVSRDGDSLVRALEAVEGGEVRVLTVTDRPVAVLRPVDAALAVERQRVHELFKDVVDDPGRDSGRNRDDNVE